MKILQKNYNDFLRAIVNGHTKFTSEFNFNSFYESHKTESIIFINHFSLWNIFRSCPEVFASVDYAFLDGSLIVHQFKKVLPNIKRRSFDLSSIAKDLIITANKHNYNIIFVGGTKDDSEKFSSWLSKKLNISRFSCINGYTPNLIDKVYDAINISDKAMIVFGLGSPLQENIISVLKNSTYGNRKYLKLITCGGFITQTALSGGNFYPEWVKRSGLRWFWRCIMQPYVIKRVVSIYPRSYFLMQRLLKSINLISY